MSEEEKARVDLNPVQVVASALAAVSSAVLLSTVGVAGTVIGAAAGSVIATVCTGIYSYSLKVSRQRVAAAAQAAAMVRFAKGGRAEGDTTEQPEPPTEEVERQRSEDERAARPSWREALGALPWKWVAIVAAAVFVIAMIVILGFELLTGRAVSQMTGGTDSGTDRTSLDWSSKKSTPTPSPTPTESSSPSGSASSSPSSSATESPSSSATPSESSTPSESPTESVTGTPSSSATSSPSSPTG